MFAQERISVDEVARELEEARSAIGAGVNMERFVQEAFRAHGGLVSEKKDALIFDPTETARAFREAIGMEDKFTICFDAARQTPGVLNLNRTHPIVEGLATHVMDTALDPISESIARRCGVIRAGQVERRTTVLLKRLRYHIIGSLQPTPLLVEDCQLLAFEGSPQNAQWLGSEMAEALLQVVPEENISHDLATNALNRIMDGFDAIRPHLDEMAIVQGDAVLNAHRRVRQASRTKGVRYNIKPILPPDVLGIYVYLPKIPS
jgi:hypothetical protein